MIEKCLLLVVLFVQFQTVGAQEMDQETAQQIWDDYHDRIQKRRMAEAKEINSLLVSEGITPENPLYIDFTFFTSHKENAESLKAQLSENYEIKIRKSDDTWLIEGTTRPYVINLSPTQHVEWVEFIHSVALSYQAIFSNWVLTEPKLNKSWSSKHIDTGLD